MKSRIVIALIAIALLASSIGAVQFSTSFDSNKQAAKQLQKSKIPSSVNFKSPALNVLPVQLAFNKLQLSRQALASVALHLTPTVSIPAGNPLEFDYRFIYGANGQVRYRAEVPFEVNCNFANNLNARLLVYSAQNALLYSAPLLNPHIGNNEITVEFLSEAPGFERGIPAKWKVEACNGNNCGLSNEGTVVPGQQY